MCTIKYSTSNSSYSVSWLSIFNQDREISRITTEREKKRITCIYDGFSHRFERACDKVIDWRCTNSNLKCKARIRTDDTESI